MSNTILTVGELIDAMSKYDRDMKVRVADGPVLTSPTVRAFANRVVVYPAKR